VIFTGDLSYSVRKGIVEINSNYPGVQLLIAHHSPVKPVNKILKSQWVNLKINGWRWIPHRSIGIFSGLIQRLFKDKCSTQSNTFPGSQYDWGNIKNLPNVVYHSCNNLHDKKTLDKIRFFNPDLGISLAAPILKTPLFSIPTLGTINLHKGKVPFYRGMPPAFWELWNNEKEVGCTIHKIEAGLDTGDVLVESAILISKYSTVKGMQLTLDELGVLLLVQAVQLIAKGDPVWRKQQIDGGKTYKKPTLKQKNRLNSKLASLNKKGAIKHIFKEIVFFSYVYLIRPIPRRLLALKNNQRVIVLLYHRVNDELRDSVTVGIEQFNKQMEIVKQTCTVVSIEDVVNGNLPKNSTRPIVAVTFDDGYLDNYDNAVPILLRHKIPAAFFISTGVIGTDNGFKHDLSALGKALPNMNWKQIKHMKQLGFTIGPHTINHINCAKDDARKVRQEIIESKQTVENTLNIKEVIFAYPFGKKEDINSDILEYVKEVGYLGCLSAYGGCNKKSIDPYNVLRMGIDYNFSALAFKARLEG